MPISLKTLATICIALSLFLGTATTVFAEGGGPDLGSDTNGRKIIGGETTGGESMNASGVSYPKPPVHFFVGLDQCRQKGNCTVCDVFKLFANVVKWILGTIGALSLFWVVYGGFDILTSAGNTTKVDGGKKKIMGAIIGMLVVLAAWTLVNAIILFLVVPTTGSPAKLGLLNSPTEWSKIKCE